MERARYQDHLTAFATRLLQDGKSKNTVASYTRDAGEFLAHLTAAAGNRVEQISEEQVAGFVAGLAGRELGERSKAKKLTSIRSFLLWARREGLIETYPRKLTFARIRAVIAAQREARALRVAG
jgi:site-specific recombinase XerD